MTKKCKNNECTNYLTEVQVKRNNNFCSLSCSTSFVNKGRKKSKETREKISKSKTGQRPWNTGLTKELDDRLKTVGEKNSKNLTGRVQKIEYVKKRALTFKLNGKTTGQNHWMHKRPLPEDFTKKSLKRNEKSSLEIAFENIIKKYNLPYKFVGNGDFVLNKKCPDFVNTNNEKIVIEVFCRKHKELLKDEGCEEWMNNRKKIFNSCGYEVLFFDETQIKEDIILEKLGKHNV